MQLAAYFERIGFRDVARPDLPTLRGLLRAHVLSVPFENLDVQLGRPLTTDVGEAFDKIVNRRRGGWCYEQNGLFGWVLAEIGFDVTRVAAAVMRSERGADADANHLALLVRMPGTDDTWLADVGFGGSLLEPIRLEQDQHFHDPFRLGLRHYDDGHWQFWENAGDGEFSFDFLPEPAREDALTKKCAQLQTDPESSFVQNLVAQIRTPTEHTTLRGRVLTRWTSAGEAARLLGSPAELTEVLARVFGLDVPAAAGRWPDIVARHKALFGED